MQNKTAPNLAHKWIQVLFNLPSFDPASLREEEEGGVVSAVTTQVKWVRQVPDAQLILIKGELVSALLRGNSDSYEYLRGLIPAQSRVLLLCGR